MAASRSDRISALGVVKNKFFALLHRLLPPQAEPDKERPYRAYAFRICFMRNMPFIGLATGFRNGYFLGPLDSIFSLPLWSPE